MVLISQTGQKNSHFLFLQFSKQREPEIVFFFFFAFISLTAVAKGILFSVDFFNFSLSSQNGCAINTLSVRQNRHSALRDEIHPEIST